MLEVFIFLIIVGLVAVVFLVIQHGGGMFAMGRSAPRSARPAGSVGTLQPPHFQNAATSFYPNNGKVNSGHFKNVGRGNGVPQVVRPSRDYTWRFRGKDGTPQSVTRQVYGLPADKTDAPPAGMTQAAYARKLAGANPKVAAEIIKQWIRSS